MPTLSLRDRLYRVTTPGTATIDDKTVHYPLGRIVDAARLDLEELEMLGAETARVIPALP